jgi:hypothetical protein
MKKFLGIALVGLALTTAACGPKAQSTGDTKVAPATGATGGTDTTGGAPAGGTTTTPSATPAP